LESSCDPKTRNKLNSLLSLASLHHLLCYNKFQFPSFMFKAVFDRRSRWSCHGLSDRKGQPLCKPNSWGLAQEEDNCMV